MYNFSLNLGFEFIVLHVVAFLEGLLVTRLHWKVNYTRKINHFFVFFLPYLIQSLFPFTPTFTSQVIMAVTGLCTLAIYVKPIRNRFRPVQLMFAAFDRPEDRPHTLKWLFTQYLATYMVAIPLWVLFEHLHHAEAILIIILINAIGDGLAEPIGVRWGKNKYRVRALFTQVRYTRSIQGSACVFITAVCVVCGFYSCFTSAQFITALLLVPVTATLAEAFSPHTWDSPFIFLFTGIALFIVYQL